MRSAYTITHPSAQTTSVVFGSPHSGRQYPPQMGRAGGLEDAILRSSEDLFVDHLFAHAPQVGAPLIAAQLPRAWVDLNRGRDELDPALIDGCSPARSSARVAGGLGVIPRVVANGRHIYQGKLPMAEAASRLRDVWDPYHRALHDMMAQTHRRFGRAILVDCHSMPPEALRGAPGQRPEIVLGDRHGAAAAPWVIDGITYAFENAGFRVARNVPFAGAYIADTYGRPDMDWHCVQIEIDRSLYVDPAHPFEPGASVAAFADRLRPVIAAIARMGAACADGVAAE